MFSNSIVVAAKIKLLLFCLVWALIVLAEKYYYVRSGKFEYFAVTATCIEIASQFLGKVVSFRKEIFSHFVLLKTLKMVGIVG